MINKGAEVVEESLDFIKLIVLVLEIFEVLECGFNFCFLRFIFKHLLRMKGFASSSDLVNPALNLTHFMPDFFLNCVEILFGILNFNRNLFIHFGIEISKIFVHNVHNFFLVSLGSHLNLFIIIFYGLFKDKLAVVPLSLFVG